MTSETEDDHALPASLRDRILRDVQAEPAPTRSTLQRRSALIMIVAFAISLVVFWVVGGVRVTDRPSWLVGATAAGTSVLAFAVAWLAFARGGSALGRPRVFLIGLALASPALLLFFKMSVSATVPGGLREWVERPGNKCFWLAFSTGLFPLLAFLFARRGSDPVHPVALGAALGAAAGTFAASLVDLWCPVAHLPHLLRGHVLPIVLLTAAGALLGRMLKPR